MVGVVLLAQNEIYLKQEVVSCDRRCVNDDFVLSLTFLCGMSSAIGTQVF